MSFEKLQDNLFFVLLGEGEEEWMVMWKDMRRRKRKKVREVRGGKDPDGAANGFAMLFRYYLLL